MVSTNTRVYSIYVSENDKKVSGHACVYMYMYTVHVHAVYACIYMHSTCTRNV